MTETVLRSSVSAPRPVKESRWSRVRAWLLEHRASILVPAIAGGGACAVWAMQWRGTDVATWVYRIDLFRSYGWMVWDSHWYGGHYLLPYSVLFPPFGAAVGLYAAAMLSAAAAAWAFERLLRSNFASGSALAGGLFAIGTWVPVAIGQFAFLSGEAAGLLALLAARHDRRLLAVTTAVVCSLFSPAAGAFLMLAAIVWLIAEPHDRRGLKIAVAGMAAVPLIILGVTFPETGYFPFWASEFLTILIICSLGLALVPSSQRILRVGLVVYAAAAVPLFVIANPLGGMFGRVAEAFAPAVVLVLGAAYRRRLLALLAVPLLVWQATPALAAVHSSSSDPSGQRAYYQSLLAHVSTGHAVERLEIPFTLNHWEAAYVAPSIPLARDTKTWSVSQGHACIQESPDHWTELVISEPGTIQVRATLTHHETDACRET
jgi:hypothetical protein